MATKATGMTLSVAVWPDPGRADRAIRALLGTSAGAHLDRLNVAVLVLTPDGRVRIHRDQRTDKGVLISGVLGAALGVLAGSPGWLLTGGAVLERLAAVAIAAGLATGPLRDVTDRLPPSGSAVIAVAAVGAGTALHRQLAILDGDVTAQPICAEVVEATGLTAAVRYDAADVDGDVIAIRTTTDADGST